MFTYQYLSISKCTLRSLLLYYLDQSLLPMYRDIYVYTFLFLIKNTKTISNCNICLSTSFKAIMQKLLFFYLDTKASIPEPCSNLIYPYKRDFRLDQSQSTQIFYLTMAPYSHGSTLYLAIKAFQLLWPSALFSESNHSLAFTKLISTCMYY